jgi:hypothetical protein
VLLVRVTRGNFVRSDRRAMRRRLVLAHIKSDPPARQDPRRRRRAHGRAASAATRIYKAAGKRIAAGVNRSIPEQVWRRPRKADGIL